LEHLIGGEEKADVDVCTLTDFAKFHEGALANATSVLQAQGKILGTNVNAISIQGF